MDLKLLMKEIIDERNTLKLYIWFIKYAKCNFSKIGHLGELIIIENSAKMSK